jgi:hypothetical protein
MAWREEESIACMKLPNKQVKSAGKKYLFRRMEVRVGWMKLDSERPGSIKSGVTLNENSGMFSHP